MGLWLRKMEQKYGKYAISNITLYLIICYIVGYVIQWTVPDMLQYLTLDAYAICHGQIWRLISWIMIPPESFDIFTVIMLFFYYSIGMSLERAWGTFTYCFYLFLGMILTIIGAFVLFGIVALNFSGADLKAVMEICAASISTYYICMSMFLAYAMTFPEAQVLLMFIIPIKVKWLGVAYAAILGFDVFQSMMIMIRVGSGSGSIWFIYLANIISIVFSVLNFIIFFIGTRKNFCTPKQVRRQREFKRRMVPVAQISKHKCAICGRTQDEYPELEFRFCSKCEGNYEYCNDHLYSHQHITNS